MTSMRGDMIGRIIININSINGLQVAREGLIESESDNLGIL
jgi:hypothetical protein